MTASPENLAGLDIEQEKRRIERATNVLQAHGSVKLTWLSGQTWQDLQRAMRGGPWHIFHFIGHGGFNSTVDEGLIALVNDEGRADFLYATQLGRLLTDHRSLRLVVLNSCEGAHGSERDIFSSTAAVLVRKGMPAVLAMQYAITDGAAIELSRVFYETLADGLPIDMAVGEARKAISLGATNTFEWGTPVLHMRSPSGALFNLTQKQAWLPNEHAVMATERKEVQQFDVSINHIQAEETTSISNEEKTSLYQVPPPRSPKGGPSSIAQLRKEGTPGQQVQNLDGVFEGEGVRVIGLVGAISVIEKAGYMFANLAGTSGGAIVATLLAAGYSAAELKQIINGIDFLALLDPPLIGRIPFFGLLAEAIFRKGIYKGDVFLNLMRSLLAQKGVHTFRDLILPEFADDDRYRFKVRVIASDITRKRMLVLPQDIREYDLVPDDLEVALAVRMSMSIPFFFMPIKLRDSYVVDGGVLSDFPVELFDSPGTPVWPTFGFKSSISTETDPSEMMLAQEMMRDTFNHPISQLIVSMPFLLAEARDKRNLSAEKVARTINIDTLGVRSADFSLTPGQKEALYMSGVRAAKTFLEQWDFEDYKMLYR